MKVGKKRIGSTIQKDADAPQKKPKSEVKISNNSSNQKAESDDEPPLFSFQSKPSQPIKSIVKSSVQPNEVKPANDKKPSKFSDLGLPKWILDTLREMGMKDPTPIQINSVPSILKGNPSNTT